MDYKSNSPALPAFTYSDNAVFLNTIFGNRYTYMQFSTALTGLLYKDWIRYIIFDIREMGFGQFQTMKAGVQLSPPAVRRQAIISADYQTEIYNWVQRGGKVLFNMMEQTSEVYTPDSVGFDTSYDVSIASTTENNWASTSDIDPQAYHFLFGVGQLDFSVTPRIPGLSAGVVNGGDTLLFEGVTKKVTISEKKIGLGTAIFSALAETVRMARSPVPALHSYFRRK